MQPDHLGYMANSSADGSGEQNSNDEKKEMTELDKYWKAVNDNAQDFTGWTYLLQYVEQEVNVTSWLLCIFCSLYAVTFCVLALSNIVFIFRMIWKLHVRHLMHFLNIIHIVMVIGKSMLILKKEMDMLIKVRRLVHSTIIFFRISLLLILRTWFDPTKSVQSMHFSIAVP